MSKESNDKDKNVLSAFYTKKDFLKIKQCLEIGKIQFSFVNIENPKKKVECYMLAEEFGAILMRDIQSGRLIRDLVDEKAKGEQYPKPVYTSPIGGNATGNNGSPICRYFTISPGSRSEVVFTGTALPAEQSSTGAFIAKKGAQALEKFNIPCAYNDLRILQYKWSFLEKDYMTKKYCLQNMKSDYQPKASAQGAQKPQNGSNGSVGGRQPENSKEKPSAAPQTQNKEASKQPPTQFQLKELSTSTLLQRYGSKGNFCFKAYSKDNKEYTVVIGSEDIPSFDGEKWNQFKDQAQAATHIRANIKYLPLNDGKLLMKGIA